MWPALGSLHCSTKVTYSSPFFLTLKSLAPVSMSSSLILSLRLAMVVLQGLAILPLSLFLSLRTAVTPALLRTCWARSGTPFLVFTRSSLKAVISSQLFLMWTFSCSRVLLKLTLSCLC